MCVGAVCPRARSCRVYVKDQLPDLVQLCPALLSAPREGSIALPCVSWDQPLCWSVTELTTFQKASLGCLSSPDLVFLRTGLCLFLRVRNDSPRLQPLPVDKFTSVLCMKCQLKSSQQWCLDFFDNSSFFKQITSCFSPSESQSACSLLGMTTPSALSLSVLSTSIPCPVKGEVLEGRTGVLGVVEGSQHAFAGMIAG